MGIKFKTVLSQNITLVYDSLDLQTIDSSKLKTLTDVQGRPMLMDTPEMIVAAYPPEPTSVIIQLADRRIRITLPQSSENIGDIPLWKIAVECNELVLKSSLIAYGFNYDVVIELAGGNASKVVVDLFIRDPETIQGALQGYLLSFIPRLKFRREQVSNDLVLEPMDNQHIKAHMNSHFEREDTTLPPQEQLKASFYGEYEYLVSVLLRLLEGDK